MPSPINFITLHPLTRDDPAPAIARFVAWQIGSRLVQEHTHRWIGNSKLIARNGMTGATGNIYCGLHEFADMGFVLHVLRPDDVFLDVGANVGSYTVLASAVCGAKTIAFEPDPQTAQHFLRNLAANAIEQRVDLHQTALGHEDGEVAFTSGLDTVNRIAVHHAGATRTVPLRKLDTVIEGKSPTLMKLDVEGFEAAVLSGAKGTLSQPSLLAVETEGQDTSVTGQLEQAGFVRRWYNPFTRSLAPAAYPGIPESNALFIRNEAEVQSRLASAPKRKVLKHWL